ncbi:MAG: XrtA/PEP-CTERM system histidine kinase PrsK [Betaproteobacteria bacterium]
MSSTSATLIAWSYGLAGVLYLAFALRVAAAPKRDLRGIALLAATAFTAAWGLLIMSYALVRAIPLLTLSSLADILSYGGWYAFLLSLAGHSAHGPAGERRTHWLVPIAVAVILWGVLAHVLGTLGLGWFGDPARMVLLDVLAAAVFGLVLVEQVFRNVSDESRWAVTPLCVGLAGAFAFDVYTFADGVLFNGIDADVWSVRGIVRTLALSLIALSIARTRGGAFSLVLSRRVMFRSTVLAMSGAYLLFVAAAGYYVRYFGGAWGKALQVALLFAAVLSLGVLIFSGSVRARLRVAVSKHFFRYRYDYREEWLRFTQALSLHGEHGAMGQQVIRGLADMVESPGGGLWLRDDAGTLFTPTAQWNMPAGQAESAGSSLVAFMMKSGWVINLEELRSAPDRYGGFELPAWLSALPNAWLIVPLAIGSEITGFVVLATARTPIEVNWEVNDLLKTAGRQAASFLGHTQATEALLEARKFEAFNRLSAFVVHDLKNIVAQLSLMLRNAERHHGNPEFQQDMLMTVAHSVERMKQLMLQLRDGTTPLDVRHRVDLADLAARVARAKAVQKTRVDVQIESPVAATGHEDRLERVMGHLVQNALDATDPAGRVWIKIGRQDDSAMVEVGDTGHGMTPEFVRERLFKPFQTYESYQYVNELGGRVLVDSTPGVGTRVCLLLPMFEATAPQMPQRDLA